MTEKQTKVTKTDNTESKKPVSKRYKTEKCKVLSFNKSTNDLDVNFKGYGIRIKNVKSVNSDYVFVKYLGDIGKPNFSYEL